MFKKRLFWFIFVLLLLSMVFIFCPRLFSDFEFAETWFALLPPVIAIVLALITKEVYSSLFVGIISGVLLYSNFNFVESIDLSANIIIGSISDSWNAGILVFLVVLGVIVLLISKAGGSVAYGKWACDRIKTRKGAILSTFTLGCLIFVDDYFNCLTVGNIMRPITDKYRISRAKLAYIIDSTAAPICIIAPISSWAAAVTGVVSDVGNNDINGFMVFLQAIPFNFYAILTIVMIIVSTLLKLDFGPMKKHEDNAVNNNDLFSGESIVQEEQTLKNENSKIIDLIIPIIILIVFSIFGMLYTGGILDGESIINAFANCDASLGLAIGSILSLILIIVFYLLRGVLSFTEIMKNLSEGFKSMVPAILILILAWSLCSVTGSSYLNASASVSAILAKDFVVAILPAVLFVIALGISFATGTSWGTFGMMLLFIIPTTGVLSTGLLIAVSATMAGAVCGDHISPISDTTIMASTGANCNHINHVKTQLPYALLVAAVSFVCYLLAGFLPYWFIMLPLSIVLMVFVLLILNRVLYKKRLNAK